MTINLVTIQNNQNNKAKETYLWYPQRLIKIFNYQHDNDHYLN